MEDSLSKYLKIGWLLLLGLLIFLLTLAAVIIGLRFFFGLFGHLPLVSLIYKMVILALPAFLFINVYIQFFRRTRRHPSAAIRYVSYFVFSACILSWLYVYVTDLRNFISYSSREVSAGFTVKNYFSYDVIFLAAHVFCLMLTGIAQALAVPPEKDWLARARENQEHSH